jgi:hypothetical protein
MLIRLAVIFALCLFSVHWQSDVGGTAIATDTWYGVRLEYDESGAPDKVQWWVDYGNNGTWTDEGETTFTADRTIPRYIILATPANMNIRIQYQIAGLKIDGSAMPTTCAR